MTVWIREGQAVDPVRSVVEKSDFVVENGRISDILPPNTFESDKSRVKIIEAGGRLILPGLMDMHVHLREPGHEYKETIASGSKAASVGGISALACMPNTLPPNDCRSITEFILEQAERAGFSKVYPVASITKGIEGNALTEFGDLKAAGAVGVSDDGLPVASSEIMRRALEYARHHGLTCISHCEEMSLSCGGVMHEGDVSTEIGLPGIPAACEEIMVYREIALARLTRCPVHIAHVSTKGSVEIIRRAKEDGIPVTAETAPHYFSLDHTAVIGYDTNAKVNPPLRTPEDVEAIRHGLASGVIDVIATDHAPHSPLEKDVEFDLASPGLIGLETLLPLTLQLVREEVLGLPEAVAKLTYAPARILGIPGGVLEKGAEADLAIVDPEHEYLLEEHALFSKSANTPFIGKTLKGINMLTMINGEVVWERDAEGSGR